MAKAQFYRYKCGKFGTMMQEMDDQKEERRDKTFNMKGVAKALAILFVLGLYVLIFLKLLFLN